MLNIYGYGGLLYANGERLNIKGVNWFGTEGQHAMLYGLEKHGLDYYLEFLAARCAAPARRASTS